MRKLVGAEKEAAAQRRREYAAAWWKANADKALAYRVAGREVKRAGREGWITGDPWQTARRAAWNIRSRSRRWGVAFDGVTKELMARLHLLPCAYCGVMPAGSADHVVALARGGTNDLSNFVPSCWPCNRAKGPRDRWGTP